MDGMLLWRWGLERKRIQTKAEKRKRVSIGRECGQETHLCVDLLCLFQVQFSETHACVLIHTNFPLSVQKSEVRPRNIHCVCTWRGDSFVQIARF